MDAKELVRRYEAGERDFVQADLAGADLTRANLGQADLRGADLHRADLGEARLYGAQVTDEQLAQAKSLEGAWLPDGTVHE